MSCDQQMLCIKTNIAIFYCSYVLLLPHIKFIEFTQLVMMDFLYHHDVMIDVLCSQNIFWCTNLNLFIFSHSKNVFWYANLYILSHAVTKSIFSVSRSMTRKFCDNAWVDSNLMQKNRVDIDITAFKWRLCMIDVTVKKHCRVNNTQPNYEKIKISSKLYGYLVCL